MAIINYIVNTEPANVQSGNDVKIFLRQWDTIAKKGKSRLITQPVSYIIPSMERMQHEIPPLLDRFGKEYPDTSFETRPLYGDKEIIWAIVKDRKKPKERKKLPEIFLEKKVSFSKQLRFFYPPFTLVDVDDHQNKVILPLENEPRRQIDLETLVSDNGCAIDIETIDYTDAEKERISNVMINFGKDKKYLITTFVHPEKKELWGCKLIGVRENSGEAIDPGESTKRIIRAANEIISREDPLKIFGYNLFAFDNIKMRELGEGEYLPGTDRTKPVFKSVQGLKNSMIRGRLGLDIYCHKFLYENLFENNKLETHARMEGMHFKKSMPYEILELKTKLGELGQVKEMEKSIYYCSRDGDVMLHIGKSNERKILSKAIFAGRSPETICTSPVNNIMKEYWEKKYFLRNNTLKDRYERWYDPSEFKISEYKANNLKIKKKDGIFKDVSLVYPLFLVNAFEPMFKSGKMKDHLGFKTPTERLDSYQTLEGYVSQAVEDMIKFQGIIGKAANPESKRNTFDYIMNKEYGIWMTMIDGKMSMDLSRTKELLGGIEQINQSNKFLYVINPEKLLEENLAFEYGKGSCLSCGNRIISLIDGKLIYSGFGLSKGNRCDFDVGLMREVLRKKLSFEENPQILDYIGNQFHGLAHGKVKNRKLLFKDRGKKKFDGKPYGFSEEGDMVIEKFLGIKHPNYKMYIQNFARAYGDILGTIFRDNSERGRLSEIMETDFKAIPLEQPTLQIQTAHPKAEVDHRFDAWDEEPF